LFGEGVSPFLLVNPSILNFGEVVTGSSRTLSFSIANVGTYPLEVSELYVEGGGFEFADEISLPFSISEESAKTINVRFSPVKIGTHAGKVIMNTSSGQAWVSLQGDGLVAMLYVEPMTVNFGPVILGESREFPLKISNVGNWFVIINKVTLDTGGDFEITEIPSIPLAMPVGDSRVIKVSFSPSSTGEREGLIKFSANFGEVRVKLRGQGRARACSCSHSESGLENSLNSLLIVLLTVFPILIRRRCLC
jgi:hypothetical protein